MNVFLHGQGEHVVNVIFVLLLLLLLVLFFTEQSEDRNSVHGRCSLQH
jgi:hypothetical protein